MNKTENYQLNQWELTDRIRMEDFNGDNAKIDAALAAVMAAVPKIVTGTYTGDGAETRTIDLGFTPKALYVSDRLGHTNADIIGSTRYWYGGLALEGHPVKIDDSNILIEIVEGGFTVICKHTSTNQYISNSNGLDYYYVALA